MKDVVVVGIGGIGKEHVRVLQDLGATVAGIVDFPDVIEREIFATDGVLINNYPGFNFTRRLGSETIVDESIDYWLARSRALHFVVAVPPSPERDLMILTLLRAGKQVYVEKPLLIDDRIVRALSQRQQWALAVGYQYQYLHVPSGAHSIGLAVPAPSEGNWRGVVQADPSHAAKRYAAMLWDLGGHVLSALSVGTWVPWEVSTGDDVLDLKNHFGTHIRLRWHAEGENPRFLIDGDPVSFDRWFTTSLALWLRGGAYDVSYALGVEGALRVLEAQLDRMARTAVPE